MHPRNPQNRKFNSDGTRTSDNKPKNDRPRGDRFPKRQVQKEDAQHFIYGINAVTALLETEPGRVHRIILKKDSDNRNLYQLQKKAKSLNIHTQQVDSRNLDKYSDRNQGVIALCHERELNNWIERKQDLVDAASGNEKVIAVIASNIEDPRNLGAAIRSCLALDVHTLILPAKGSCGITPLTAKTSAGAVEKLAICRPENIEKEVESLKKAGFTVVGLDSDTDEVLGATKLSDQLLMIVGGEDKGIPPYLRKQCDHIVKIPMNPEAHSFNTTVALSIGLYEVRK